MSIWPVEGNGPNQFSMFKAKMAMAILGKNKHYLFKDIQRRHFNSMAGKCFDRIDAEAVISRVIAATPIAIEAMKRKLPEGFPVWIAESVFDELRRSAQLLEKMPKS
jgi:serine/threonine-protein kinase HipA